MDVETEIAIAEGCRDLLSASMNDALDIIRYSTNQARVDAEIHWMLHTGFEWYGAIGVKIKDYEEYANWVRSRCQGNIPNSSYPKRSLRS